MSCDPVTAPPRSPAGRRRRGVRPALFVLLALCSQIAWCESPHVFGVHFWDWGADLDLMNGQQGWVVEASSSDGYPNIGGRYAPALAEGFTIVQRLDWEISDDCARGTIPVDPADYAPFAQQCAERWALPLRNYCRHFVIGNEMEICGPISASEYTACFRLVREAIRNVHPEALVIVGAFTSIQNLRSTLQALGPDGYDGVAAHWNGVPSDMCELLDELDARPGVGVYITEFGWVIGTNPSASAEMRRIYNDIGSWNVVPSNRPVYCSCWYFYPEWLPSANVFSLELGPVENHAFEACTALGTSRNPFANDVVRMSDLYVEVSATSADVVARWSTDSPTRSTIWYLPSRAHNGEFVHLSSAATQDHEVTIHDPYHWHPRKEYAAVFRSIAVGRGDGSVGPVQVASGPCRVEAIDITGERARIVWTSWFASTGRVEFGTSPHLGREQVGTGPTVDHDITLTGLSPHTTYHARAWAEADGYAPHASELFTFVTGPPSPRLGTWETSRAPVGRPNTTIPEGQNPDTEGRS